MCILLSCQCDTRSDNEKLDVTAATEQRITQAHPFFSRFGSLNKHNLSSKVLKVILACI